MAACSLHFSLRSPPSSHCCLSFSFSLFQKPMLVSGNTAAMLSESYLRKFFTVYGSRATHFGQFSAGGPCARGGLFGAPTAAFSQTVAAQPTGGCCGSKKSKKSGCC